MFFLTHLWAVSHPHPPGAVSYQPPTTATSSGRWSTMHRPRTLSDIGGPPTTDRPHLFDCSPPLSARQASRYGEKSGIDATGVASIPDFSRFGTSAGGPTGAGIRLRR